MRSSNEEQDLGSMCVLCWLGSYSSRLQHACGPNGGSAAPGTRRARAGPQYSEGGSSGAFFACNRGPARGVTSSCLCKKSEGAVLPLLIEPLKNRIDDSLHAGHIHEQHHGPGAPADFHEASFDGIGGAQLAPQRLREIEEREQFGQIALQPPHQCRIDPLPAKAKSLEGATGLRGVARQIDALRIAFDLRLVAPPYAVAQVAHPVHPAALMTCLGIDGLDRCGQTRTAIAEHHPKLTAGQSALVQIPQKDFPGR